MKKIGILKFYPIFKSCYQNKHLFKEQVQTLSLERLCNLISFSVLFSYHSFLPISQYMPTKPPTFPRSPRAVLSNCNLHMNNLEIVLKCIFLLSRPWKAFEFIFVSYLFVFVIAVFKIEVQLIYNILVSDVPHNYSMLVYIAK